MKYLNILLFCLFSLVGCGQINKPNRTMDTSKITNETARKAINALQAADKTAWFSLFSSDTKLYDDGNEMNFRSFFDKALGHEYFTSIDKVEHNGLSIYGKFHSDMWGNFKTYFKFSIGSDGKINRVEIGQAE